MDISKGDERMPLNQIGVVGAGMMGAEIALCYARAGYAVVMSDASIELAQNGKDRQTAILERNVMKGRISEEEKGKALSLISITDHLEDMKDCDLVVEAVSENYGLKKSIYIKLDEVCKPETMIASNTSSISITKLASNVRKERAEKFIGTHYFSPASIMKLVEVIPGICTLPETVETVKEALVRTEKAPILVKDVTGFAVNRLFHVYTAEACRLLEEGVASAEDIDTACVLGLGYPIGPFKLLDNMGHDLNIAVDKVLFEAYGERFRPSQYMQKLVDAGQLGKKSGKGFYDYEE